MLSRSRTAYQESVKELAGYDSLDEATRKLLRPILRQLAVQQAAMEGSWWWRVYAATRAVTALAVIALPIVGMLLLTTEGRVASLIVYALLLGTVAVAYGIQQHQTSPWQLAVASLLAGALLAGWATLSPWQDSVGWYAVQVALVATVAATGLVVLRLLGLIALRDRLFWPVALRRAGWLLPSQHTAVRLLLLVEALQGAAPTNRHPRFRRNFVRWMDKLIESIEWEVPTVARNLRLGSTAVTDARRRTRQLGAYLRGLQVRMLHEPSPEAYAEIDAEVAGLVGRIVRGDWSTLPAEPEGAGVQSALLRFGRRLVTALSLLAVAGGLPYLPGISADSATVGGIQLGLVVAAALSLLPVEAAHREQAFSTFRG